MSIERSTVEQRKGMPLASGVLDYFPDALLVVAEVSRIGNEQHHPGQPLHWDKSKSIDEADALMRHLIDRGTLDSDGVRHSAKVAWRALALLQRELDAEAAEQPFEVEAFIQSKLAIAEELRRTPPIEDFGFGIDPERYAVEYRVNDDGSVDVRPAKCYCEECLSTVYADRCAAGCKSC